MSSFKKIVLCLLFALALTELLLPLSVSAGDYQDVQGRLIHYEGLVPCGKGQDNLAAGESALVAEPCQLCHLFVMIDGIIDFMINIILAPLVIFMIAIAGIMFFFAGTNPEMLSKAKQLLKSIVIGLLIIFSAYVIIGSFFTAIGLADDNPIKDWFQGDGFTFICPIDYSETNGGAGGNGSNGGNGNVTIHEKQTDPNGGEIQTVYEECSENEGLLSHECLVAQGEEETTILIDEGAWGDNGWFCKFESLVDNAAPVGEVKIGCGPEGTDVALTEEECEAQGGFWWGDECHDGEWHPCIPYPEYGESCQGEALVTFELGYCKGCPGGMTAQSGECYKSTGWTSYTSSGGYVSDSGDWCCNVPDDNSPRYNFVYCVPETDDGEVTNEEENTGEEGEEETYSKFGQSDSTAEIKVVANCGEGVFKEGSCDPGEDTLVDGEGQEDNGYYCNFKKVPLVDALPSGTTTVICIVE